MRKSPSTPDSSWLKGPRLYDRSPLAERAISASARSVVITRPLGDKGLYVASDGQAKYGVVDKDWNWVVEPVLDDIYVQEGAGVATGYGAEGSMMVTADGKLIGAGQQYDRQRHFSDDQRVS